MGKRMTDHAAFRIIPRDLALRLLLGLAIFAWAIFQ